MKKRIICILIAIAACSAVISGCSKKDPGLTPEEILAQQLTTVDKAQLTADLNIIDDSLAKYDIVPLKEIHGVRYVITTPGTGTKPTLTSTITVNYKLRNLSKGVKNDSIYNEKRENYVTTFDPLFIGWKTTIPQLTKGTKATLYMPSGYAYGATDTKNLNGVVVIPANSNVVYEVELVEVTD